MWGQAPFRPAKDVLFRDERRLVQPGAKPCERPDRLQPTRPSEGSRPLGAALNPIHNQLLCDGSPMTPLIGKVRKPHQELAWNFQSKSSATPLFQIRLHERLHGSGSSHSCLPGHGRATASSLRKSTFV